MEEKRTNATFENLDQEKLKRMLQIKQQYEQGYLSVDEAKARVKKEVGRISPEEFAAAEQMYKDEDPDECRNEDARTILDIFDGLISEEEEALPFGHSIDAYRRENDALKQLLLKGDGLAKKPFILNPWLELMEEILPYKVHYSRKQNQLYSALERQGFDRPSTTMWVYDDEVRDMINEAYELLQAEEVEVDKFLGLYERLAYDARDLMEKEELILYPTSLKLIPEEEFEEMKSGDREIGFYRIDMPELEPAYSGSSSPAVAPSSPTIASTPATAPSSVATAPSSAATAPSSATTTPSSTAAAPSSTAAAPSSAATTSSSPAGTSLAGDFMDDLALLLAKHGMGGGGGIDPATDVLDVAEGKLTLNQINLLFRHLPVDISYVDENDLVKFYTDTEERVFPRSKGVIGREVRNCHPPKSLHMVEEIIEKFRSGKESKAEFWINKPGLFIYIVYVAVRDKDGTFRGVMEMMQDCTRIRAFEGERRLLTWEEEQKLNAAVSPESGGAGDGHTTEPVTGRNDELAETGNTGNNSNTAQSESTQSESAQSESAQSENEELVITPDTKLKALLDRYPRLKDDLTTISPKFSMLKSPMARVVLPLATLKLMSEQSGVPREELIEKLNNLIATY